MIFASNVSNGEYKIGPFRLFVCLRRGKSTITRSCAYVFITFFLGGGGIVREGVSLLRHFHFNMFLQHYNVNLP